MNKLGSTYNVNTHDLNFSEDSISCKGLEQSGGKISTGFSFENNNNTYKIKDGNCANIIFTSDTNGYKKGSILDNVCDCEIVSVKNNSIICPDNKYIRSYYPSTNKATCCSPCSYDNSVKVEFNDGDCSTINLNKTSNLAICPQNQFNNGINFKDLTIRCCTPHVGGLVGSDLLVLKDKCKKMGIMTPSCSDEIVNKYDMACKGYGILNCNHDNILNMETKCDKYGMRYKDIDTDIPRNTDSYLDCHENNFMDLDKFCSEKSINPCNWETIQEWKKHTNDQMIKNIVNMDKVQDKIDTRVNRMYIYMSVVFLLVIVLFIFLFMYRHKLWIK